MAHKDGNYKTTTKKRRPRRTRPTDPVKVGSSGMGGYIKKSMNRNF